MQCIDLNTMTPVYAQDLGGSTDAALLFERTEEGAFLYSGSYSADSSAHIRKLNAVSGEVIWQKDLGGSIWASPVLGTGCLLYTSRHTPWREMESTSAPVALPNAWCVIIMTSVNAVSVKPAVNHRSAGMPICIT